MIIEIVLPKLGAFRLQISERRLLFEALGEFEQVACRGFAEREEMQVIGHGAIGVDKEFGEDRFCPEKFQDPGGTPGVGENRSAVMAAHGDEEPLSTYVFFGG